MARYEVQTLIAVTGLDAGVMYEIIGRRLVMLDRVDENVVELDDTQLARLRRIRRLIADFDLTLDALELVLAMCDEVDQRRTGPD